jgi:hypothetical protein
MQRVFSRFSHEEAIQSISSTMSPENYIIKTLKDSTSLFKKTLAGHRCDPIRKFLHLRQAL